jgi:V8-like Glu-specific endopeptidase
MRRRSHSVPRLASVLAALACLATPAALAAPAGASAPARLQPAAPAAPGEAVRIAGYWTAARMLATPPLAAPGGDRAVASASFGPVATPTEPPNAVNGRLFVLQGGKRGHCSATAIDTPSRRLVLTTAHCVNSGPRGRRGRSSWSRYVEFVPAFTNGTAPFGAFVAHRSDVFAPRQWVKFGNPNFDVGAILTTPNAEGVNVADAVGGVTIALDRSRRQEFQTFGYPGKSTAMQECASPYVGDDVITYRIPGPPTIAIRCHWAPGASGGGWLIEGGSQINGLTSYGKRRNRINTFSPYFSQATVGRLVAGL